jgi:serine/threonine-protein kinase
MAPEQIRGADIDARVDVYAFGVVLYEALTGQLPFVGDSYADLVLSVLSSGPKPLNTVRADVPAPLCAIIDKAMARDRNDRYATLLELSAALAPFCSASLPAHATRSSRERVPSPASEPILATPFVADSGALPAPVHTQRALTWAAYGVGLSLLVVTPLVLYLRRGETAPLPEAHLAAPLDPKLLAPQKEEPSDRPAEPQDDLHPNTQPIAPELPSGSSEPQLDAGAREQEPRPNPPRRVNEPERSARNTRKAGRLAPLSAADHSPSQPGNRNAATSGNATEPGPTKPRVSLGSSDFQGGADADKPARPRTTLDSTGF